MQHQRLFFMDSAPPQQPSFIRSLQQYASNPWAFDVPDPNCFQWATYEEYLEHRRVIDQHLANLENPEYIKMLALKYLDILRQGETMKSIIIAKEYLRQLEEENRRKQREHKLKFDPYWKQFLSEDLQG
jgi:hypothetical protein